MIARQYYCSLGLILDESKDIGTDHRTKSGVKITELVPSELSNKNKQRKIGSHYVLVLIPLQA